MNKDKEWYREVINNKLNAIGEISQWHSGYKKGLYECLLLSKEIEESEITEEQAWKVIGEVYADTEKGRLMNGKKIFDEGLKMQGIVNTVNFKLNKREFKGTFEDFVSDLIKQTELPVIPQFVADWYEGHKSSIYYHICTAISSAVNKNANSMPLNKFEFWLMDFENENIGKILNLKNGYTIEKEQMYYAILAESENKEVGQALYKTFNFEGDKVISTYIAPFSKRIALEAGNFHFTEQEIKAIDERYWAFAEEVTQ